MQSKNYKQIHSLDEQKLMDKFVLFFRKFDKFFENAKVDDIVNQEFTQQYALLPLLVKARMYYNEQ